jgi:hypothetical protein
MRLAPSPAAPARRRSEAAPVFAYFTDKTFLSACSLYAANRFWGKPLLGDSLHFLRDHFDDCLLLPAALPPLLYVFRKLGLRRDDSPPSIREVAEWTFIWSVAFEWAFPHFLHKGVSDLRDVLGYAAGGLVSWLLWRGGTVSRKTHQTHAGAERGTRQTVRPFSIR